VDFLLVGYFETGDLVAQEDQLAGTKVKEGGTAGPSSMSLITGLRIERGGSGASGSEREKQAEPTHGQGNRRKRLLLTLLLHY
jgi:hypothetical protein